MVVMTSVCSQAISEAADRLAQASKTGETCAPIRDLIGREDIDAAYRVQSRNIEVLLASGRRIIGRKIGLTSPAVQHQLGVDQPTLGCCSTTWIVRTTPRWTSRVCCNPRSRPRSPSFFEPTLPSGSLLSRRRSSWTGVFAAFEIVDSRVANWDISLADTVADNASAGLYVLGGSEWTESMLPTSPRSR